jgi:hypothetical protein
VRLRRELTTLSVTVDVRLMRFRRKEIEMAEEQYARSEAIRAAIKQPPKNSRGRKDCRFVTRRHKPSPPLVIS